MKRTIAGLVVALGVVGMSGAPAVAGERGGNGEATPINEYRANSICSFSGLDDMDFEAPVEPGVVQNWGIIPKEIRDILASEGAHPGEACRGNVSGPHP